MSIDIIQAILKMDHGALIIREDYEFKNGKKEFKLFKTRLECRFGELKVECVDVAVALHELSSMYQTLETSKVTVEKGVSF